MLKRLESLKAQLRKTKQESGKILDKVLPTQQKVFDALLDPKIHCVILTSPNQYGKTHCNIASGIADALGWYPWDGRITLQPVPTHTAWLIPDYDSHGRNLIKKLLDMYPPHKLKIHCTQQGAPRAVDFLDTGSTWQMFTHDQEVRRLEGGTYNALKIDEPCPRSHYIALRRGLQRNRGKTLFTMTPLTEPWIFDELYSQAGNNGGPHKWCAAFTAFPDENKRSQGGFLDDEDVELFRANLTEEEKEARVKGKWVHLIGRVYKSFNEKVHVIDDVDPSMGTKGIVIDPHDRLAFAITWFYVTPNGDKVIYDEWPKEDYHSIRYCDHSIEDYINIIESNEPTTYRYMDPNYGPRRTIVSGLSIAESFQVRGMYFNTEINDDVTAGHKAVQEELRYRTDKPVDALNKPKLFFSRRCHNHIRSMLYYTWDEWTGRGSDGRAPKQKPKEKYKHFADNVRYLCMMNPRFIGDSRKMERYRDDMSPEWLSGRAGGGGHRRYVSAADEIRKMIEEAQRSPMDKWR